MEGCRVLKSLHAGVSQASVGFDPTLWIWPKQLFAKALDPQLMSATTLTVRAEMEVMQNSGSKTQLQEPPQCPLVVKATPALCRYSIVIESLCNGIHHTRAANSGRRVDIIMT